MACPQPCGSFSHHGLNPVALALFRLPNRFGPAGYLSSPCRLFLPWGMFTVTEPPNPMIGGGKHSAMFTNRSRLDVVSLPTYRAYGEARLRQ